MEKEKKRAIILNGSDEDIERIKKSDGFVNNGGLCLLVPEGTSEGAIDDGFYKDKIASLQAENKTLRCSLKDCTERLEEAMKKIDEKNQRIDKLEKALIEAAIK